MVNGRARRINALRRRLDSDHGRNVSRDLIGNLGLVGKLASDQIEWRSGLNAGHRRQAKAGTVVIDIFKGLFRLHVRLMFIILNVGRVGLGLSLPL